MIQFLHDPTMSKVQLSFGVAFAGFVGLWGLAANIQWERRRDINRPEVFRREMYAEDDVEEIVVEGALPIPVVHLASPALTPGRASFALFCVTLIGAGAWFGARNYSIVHSLEVAEVSISNKDYSGAEDLCRKAIRIDAEVPRSHLLLAQSLLRQNETLKAVPELRLAVRNNHTDADIHVVLGDALQRADLPAQAVPEYEEAIAIAPKQVESYVRLGSALVKTNRIGDAIKEFRFAILLNPKDVKAHANLGYALMMQGDGNAGLAQLRQCVEIAPDDIAAHNELGNAYVHAHRYADATAEFRTSVAIDPEFAIAYFNLGIALMNMGATGGAIDAFESYVRKCANNPDAGMAVAAADQYVKKLRNKLNAGQSRLSLNDRGNERRQ